ncbi:MAG: DUF5666 domain-containing protein [bacterium]|nr:DUF5666 domain-containing protein [bacterium]
MNQKNLIITIIVAVVVGAGSFFGGMKYQQTKVAGFRQGGQGFAKGGGNTQGRTGQGRPVAGEITDSDATSITVKMMDGSTRIVILSEKTQINKASAGSKSDLTKGEQVAVFGTQNSDGSVTAQNIQLKRNRPTPSPTK